MEHLSLYLEKFKQFGFKDQILKEAVVEVIKSRFGANISKSDIFIEDKIVRINISGPLKSEIFINKDKIQKDVIKILGDEKELKNIK